ncbi:hypothetical protein ACJJTC_014852 [Scirpophaga incertulas]
MRKISKTRTDDDVVSSTNGSVVNDDQAIDAEPTNEVQNVEETEFEEPVDDSTEHSIDDTSDVSKEKQHKNNKTAKTKAKKKKFEKEEEEYEVEKIIDSKKIKGKLHYLIRWKGYAADSDTWEPEHTVSCPDLINKFIEEKENSKAKETKSKKKTGKRSASKEAKVAPKRAKTTWDSKNADENAEYEVDRILEVHHKKNGKREFLIHWKGCPASSILGNQKVI